jgi:peptidoglycan hydrolase-like protein with peptidoglycan-binding domain
MHCYTDCRGGGVSFRQLDSNSVLAIFDDFSFSGEFVSETSMYSDPETTLSAALVLSRLDDPVCRLAKPPGGLRVVLMPGDVSPYVEQAKTALSTMGYPIVSIDRIFDSDARGSLQAFQSSIGLPATGYLDAETLTMLKVHAPSTGC